MKYKLVIFDFDGTLADSIPWAISVMNGVAEKHGFKQLDADDLDTIRGFGARAIARYIGLPLWKVPAVGRELRKMMKRDIQRIPLFEGVGGLLERLAQLDVALAVVSSNSRDNVRCILGPQNAARINYYECGVALMGKSERFRKVLRRAGVRPHDALCIGDEIRDLEAARKARIPFGAVSWGYNLAEALRERRPQAVFASMSDILAEVAG